MATTIKVGPLTRVEGHLDVEVVVDAVGGKNLVVDAKCSGTMFRGFEAILAGRDPYDAITLTQRICGVCPVSHAMASVNALEAAFAIVSPANGRILRNLVLGANFIQSHILHFYHLTLPDYVDTTGALNMAPWTPRFMSSDLIGGSTASSLVNSYVAALAMRRKAHQMGAVFGGRLPCPSTFLAGGCSEVPTSAKITQFRTLLTELRNFIDTVFIPDVQKVAAAFANYYQIGKGYGNLMAYGVFDLDAAGTNKLLKRGRLTNGTLGTVDVNQIKEYVKYSWYSSGSGLNPKAGATKPSSSKAGAYSWIKAPRYLDQPHEAGPLARMWVTGDYRRGVSVMDRLMARALETKKVADAMATWLTQLTVNGTGLKMGTKKATATGIGLTEAPRGALGHWVAVSSSVVKTYQFLAPTGWNASPKDDKGLAGPIEKALIGTPVTNTNEPIEVLRVVHSFDPCLACSVHMARPGQKAKLVATL